MRSHTVSYLVSVSVWSHHENRFRTYAATCLKISTIAWRTSMRYHLHSVLSLEKTTKTSYHHSLHVSIYLHRTAASCCPYPEPHPVNPIQESPCKTAQVLHASAPPVLPCFCLLPPEEGRFVGVCHIEAPHPSTRQRTLFFFASFFFHKKKEGQFDIALVIWYLFTSLFLRYATSVS